MATATLVVPSIVPTTSMTFNLSLPYMTHPASIKGFGTLPTMPSTLGSINSPNIQAAMHASEAQAFQMLTTQYGVIVPIAAFLGSSIDALLPALPTAGIPFTALLTGNADTVLKMFQSAMGGIPSLYNYLSIPDLSDRQTMRQLVRTYISTTSASIYSAITLVTNKLSISAMPAIPTMPTMSQMQAKMVANIPSATSMADAMKKMVANKIPTSQLVNGISYPGFTTVFTAPTEAFPSISSVELESQEHIINMIGTIQIDLLQPIVNFCQNTLSSYMPFSFGPVTFTLTV